MSDDVLTYEQACERLGIRRRRLFQLLREGRLDKAATGRRLANGHDEMGVTMASIQDYGAPDLTDCSPERHSVSRGNAGGQPDAPDRLATFLPAGVLAEHAGEHADPQPIRQTTLLPADIPSHIPVTHDGVPDVAAMQAMGLAGEADEWSRRMRICAEAEQAQADAPHGARRAAVRRVAATYGVGRSTLYRWIKLLEEAGPTGLVRAYGKSRGSTVLPDELQRQILAYYRTNRRPTYAQVHAKVVVPWYANDGRQCPHECTTRALIQSRVLPLEEIALRTGPWAFEAHAAPKVTRELPPAGQIWCADHRIQDVMVLDEDGRPKRPWATVIIDIGSAAIVGWCLAETPSSDTVAAALFHALLGWGVPERFQRDNGKEFVANRLGGKANRLSRPHADDLRGTSRWSAAMDDAVESAGIWQTLGVELTTALPYHSWSKPIEPTFRAFRDFAGENLLPGWTGIDAKDKPESLAGNIKAGRLLAWDQFEEWFADNVARWNSTHICGERTAPPNSLYVDARARARHLSPDTLSFLLQRTQRARVKARGVAFLKREWWAEELALYVGSHVTVRGLPGVDWAFAYVSGDRVIALRPKPRASWDTADGPANQLARRGRKLQRTYLRAVAAQDSEVPLDVLDPDGAWRQAAANAQHHADADKGGADVLEGGAPAPSPALASPQQRQAALASAEPPDEDNRRTVYQDDPELQSIRDLRRRLAQ